MGFEPGIKAGAIIRNNEISEIFMCSTQGGMRPSRRTNTLVLTSDPKRPLYQDVWQENVLHYTGMGTRGDQDINFRQNRTLRDSPSSGLQVFLFEKLGTNRYLFHGEVVLADEPYEQVQADLDGNDRRVWIFPIELARQSVPTAMPEADWDERTERLARQARRMTIDELERRMTESASPTARPIASIRRSRDPYLAELVKRSANGKCQLCGMDAPFIDPGGFPFLEEHHIRWLSRGGSDTLDNAVALCPNCHRRMHRLDLESDKSKLRQSLLKANLP